MKPKAILIALFIGSQSIAAQNISVDSSYPKNDPLWLAQNIIAGPALTVFSPIGPSGLPIIQPTSVQLGKFTNPNPNFGLDSGVVLCTSNAYDVMVGSNGSYFSSSLTPSPRLTSILNQIGGTNTNLYDRSSIEFSFVSSNDTLFLDYIFASTEYTSYTCSPFNDVFGLFLIGQGINGAPMFNSNGTPRIDTVNLALIPNSNIPNNSRTSA